MDKLMTRTKVKDGKTVTRSHRTDKQFVPTTTGPRSGNRLPREVQDTTYPRTHLRHFGA
jgi:hypothetical protein